MAKHAMVPKGTSAHQPKHAPKNTGHHPPGAPKSGKKAGK